MNFTFTNFARIDAASVVDLLANGEWDRAHKRAQLLANSIELAMKELGIEPSASYIYDSTIN
jgi:hypothetical protein